MPEPKKQYARLEDLRDAEGRSLFFRAADLRARDLLLDWAEDAYSKGQHRQAALFFHACMYLQDRLAYELFPPPGKLAIPVEVGIEEGGTGEQWCQE